MPIINNRNLPSLKGVFPGVPPKPKRNFLRENKLKIKEIQTKTNPPDKAKSFPKLEKRGSSLSSRSNTNCSCPCNCSGDERVKIVPSKNDTVKVPACMTKTIKVCDQESQTEEIVDEDFLLSSLKKCSSNEVQNLVLKENDIDDLEDEGDNMSNNFQTMDLNQDSSRQNGLNSKRTTSRSTATRISMESKGKREIKLPKYLQREKMEKEEQRLREELKDHNCPDGHFPLPEAERRSCLESAEKKYQQLLNEFNRLPFASETLKLRSKKMNIEKNLAELENDIKLFSKSVVYMKLSTQ